MYATCYGQKLMPLPSTALHSWSHRSPADSRIACTTPLAAQQLPLGAHSLAVARSNWGPSVRRALATAAATEAAPAGNVLTKKSAEGTQADVEEPTPAVDSPQPTDAASVAAGSPGHDGSSADGALQGDVSDEALESDMDDSGYSEGGAGCDESACSLDFGDM